MFTDISKSMTMIDFSTIILSFVATIMSIMSLFVSKRQLINTAITNNRIEWINSVRDLVRQFISAYLENRDENALEKRNLSAAIKLYLRHDVSIYKSFLDALEKCTAEKFDESDYENLIHTTQDMLNDVWNRMKREAGVSKWSEQRLKKKLKAEKTKKRK